MFRDKLNTGLAHKLVKIGGINEILTLEEWYLKAVKFERARWIAEDIFRRQTIKLSRLAPRIEEKPVQKTGEHDMLVKKSSSMDIDIMRRQDICFNYKEKEYIATWCSKPREPRKYFGRKLKIEKSVDKITEEELRKFVKR